MIDGIINVYKEKGFTSHDVVAKMRRILHQKKIGHTGTLDPDATGVLPVCLGRGTKLCDLLTDKDKTYEAVLLLGITTDTEDITGQILTRNEVTVSPEQVRATAAKFIGAYNQIPPMYSAIKQNGKKLYELARAGQIVERQARPVVIHELIIDEIDLPRVKMTVSCSKGTYIRTLCYDIGQALGCGGCMEALQRTRVGRFVAADSLTLSAIEALHQAGRLDEQVIPVDGMFLDYPKAVTAKEYDVLVHNGNSLRQEHFLEASAVDGPIRVYDADGHFIGLYQYDPKRDQFLIQKMFFGGTYK